MKREFHNPVGGTGFLKSELGASLVIILMFLTLLSTLALGAIHIASLNLLSSKAQGKGKMVFYSAEVGLDMAVNDIIKEFENLNIYSASANYAGADAEGYMTRTVKGNTVRYKVTNPLEPFLYQSLVGNTTMYHYAYTYNIEGTTTAPDGSKEKLLETIRILETPLVQYFLFWGGSGDAADLELYPAAQFLAWGRIHANRNIYIGSSAGLEIRNYDTDGVISPHGVTLAGELFRLRKDSLANDWGGGYDVSIKAGSSTTLSMAPEQAITANVTAANEVAEEARFNNYLLIKEQAYSTTAPKQLKRGDFYESRSENPNRSGVDGMKIVGQGPLGAGGTRVYVSRPAFTEVTDNIIAGTLSGGAPSSVTLPMISETLSAFCDNRENRLVNFTNIDLYKLETWYNEYLANIGETLGTAGFLIYVSRSPNAAFTNLAGNMESVRLMQLGGSSPQLLNETTLATDNPLYIHGNFNTVSTRGTVLIADAHNLLSNTFTTKACGQSINNIAMPTATTVNAALIGGNVPQAAGSGLRDGGAHNYPRMHEQWTGVNTNIKGSFINLGSSLAATSAWTYNMDDYRAPNRNWGWDINFQNPSYWPPFIPSIFSVERVGFLE